MKYAKVTKVKKLAGGGGILSSILGGAGVASNMMPGVGTATSLMTGMVTAGIARTKAEKQKTAMLNQMWQEKEVQDAQLLDDYGIYA